MRKLPTWAYGLIGIVAIVAGVLGVTHAPPAIAKVFWSIIILVGAALLTYAAKRAANSRPSPTGRTSTSSSR